MKGKRKKTRSIASYRAASLKAARTRRRMQDENKRLEADYREFIRHRLDPPLIKQTIDLIPKVKWP